MTILAINKVSGSLKNKGFKNPNAPCSKRCVINDPELFKKLNEFIWEFRTKYNKNYYRLLAFWDKTEKEDTLVLATHGFIKKTNKTPKTEIKKAEEIRKEYFERKTEKNEKR
jgi:phage-related protein